MRRLSNISLLFLVTACQDPVLLIDTSREPGYLGRVTIEVCDPIPALTCTEQKTVFEADDTDGEEQIAVFFDDPPAAIDLQMEQTDCHRVPLNRVTDVETPIRFELVFRKEGPPTTKDCPTDVCLPPVSCPTQIK